MNEGAYWNRFGRRLTRRRLMQGAAAGGAGLAAVAAVGCGGGESGPKAATGTVAAETPQKGGIVRISFPGESSTYDPHVYTGGGNIIRTNGLFERLMDMDPDTLELKPWMLTKWEFPDPTTLVLQVREGVKFFDKPPANGRLLTAEDIAYGLNRARTPDPQITYNSRFSKIDSVQATDAKTVRVKMKAPSAGTLTFLAGEAVINRESLEAAGGVFKDPRQVVATGPFICTEFQAGVGGKLTRNPNYWDAGKPYLDGINWTQILDTAAVVAAFRTGDLDLGLSVSGSLDPVQKKQLEQSNPSVVFKRFASGFPATFLTDNAKPPFNDVRVRKAVDLVTDRQQLVQLVLAGAGAPASPIWEGFLPGYGFPDKELLARPGYRQPKDQDIAEAKKLLEAAGYKDGLDLPADGTEYSAQLNLDPVTVSVQQFAKAGIKLHVDKLLDRTTFLDVAGKGQALFRAFGVIAAVEAGDQLRTRYYSKAPRNYQHYVNRDVDQMIDKQDEILNVDERKALLLKAQRQILDDVAVVHTTWGYSFLVFQPWIRGVRPTPDAFSYGRSSDWWRTKA